MCSIVVFDVVWGQTTYDMPHIVLMCQFFFFFLCNGMHILRIITSNITRNNQDQQKNPRVKRLVI